MDEKLREIEQHVMRERAQILAKPLNVDTDQNESVNILMFSAMNAQFACLLSSVEAVSKISNILSIPNTPQHIPGVIRRGGNTIALVNMRFFFYPQTEGLIDEDYAIILKSHSKIFALQVNDVIGVQSMLKADIKPIPENFDNKVAPFVDGLTGQNTALINIEKMVMSDGFGTTRIE